MQWVPYRKFSNLRRNCWMWTQDCIYFSWWKCSRIALFLCQYWAIYVHNRLNVCGRCHCQFRQFFFNDFWENLWKFSTMAKFCRLRRKWKLKTLRDVEDSSISNFCHFDDNFGPLISLANIHDRLATNAISRHPYHESRNGRMKTVRYFRHEMAKVKEFLQGAFTKITITPTSAHTIYFSIPVLHHHTVTYTYTRRPITNPAPTQEHIRTEEGTN